MLKQRRWLVTLLLLLLISSTNATDKNRPYPDGKDNIETFGVEITGPVLEL